MELLYSEIVAVPGTLGAYPTEPVGSGAKPLPGSTVLRLVNSTPQENLFTVSLTCDHLFWSDDWYQMIPLPPDDAHAGVKPDEVDPRGRWAKVFMARESQRDVLIRFAIPQTPEARAGLCNLQFQVTDSVEDGYSTSTSGTLTIQPYYNWTLDVVPQTPAVSLLKRNGQMQIVVTNEGNDWLYCGIDCPPIKDADVTLSTTRIAVPPANPYFELPDPTSQTGYRIGIARSVPLAVSTQLKTVVGAPVPQPVKLTATRFDVLEPEAATGTTVHVAAQAPRLTPSKDVKNAPDTVAVVYNPLLSPAFAPAKISALLKEFSALVVAIAALIIIGVVAFQGVMYHDISLDPVLPVDHTHNTVTVKGKWLKGAVFTVGGNQVHATEQPLSTASTNLDFVSLPLAPGTPDPVVIKAQRTVVGMPALTPLLPSAAWTGPLNAPAAAPSAVPVAGSTTAPTASTQPSAGGTSQGQPASATPPASNAPLVVPVLPSPKGSVPPMQPAVVQPIAPPSTNGAAATPAANGSTPGMPSTPAAQPSTVQVQPQSPIVAQFYAALHAPRNRVRRALASTLKKAGPIRRIANAATSAAAGLILLRMNRFPMAFSALTRSLIIDPKLSLGYAGLGEYYADVALRTRSARSSQQALAFFKKALVLDPNSLIANYEIARFYYLTGNYNAALEYCDTLISKVDPQFAAAYLLRRDVDRKLHWNAEAALDQAKATEIDATAAARWK